MAIVYGTNIENNAVPSLDLRFSDRKDLVDTISGNNLIDFSRSSIGTYYDADGVLKTSSANQARFDHDPTTGESLGLLVEEAKTNSSIYSEQLPYGWRANAVGSITPNIDIALDGTITVTKVIPAAGNNESNSLLYRGTSIGSTFVFSAYLKAGELNQASLHAYSSGANWARVSFNLTTGEVVSTFGGYLQDQGSEYIRDGWWRCWIKVQSVDNSVRVGGGSGETASFDGAKGFYICHPQAEAGSFPTSYIPTPATFVSRADSTQGASYYDANGIIQYTALGAARDDAYFPDENGVMRPAGLLLEAAKTNHIDESVNLTDDGTWSNYKFLTPTLNAGTAPDGTNTATSAVPNTENIGRSLSCYNIATTFQGTLTVSVFAKANGYNKFKLSIDAASAGGAFGGIATFDLSTGTVTQGASGVGTITKLPNGWYRCAVTHTNTAQAFTIWPGISGLDNSGNTVWAGDGTSGYLFWGFQLEESPYPTSYIPTTTATVTRAADVSSSSTVTRSADVASITGSNFSSWYNQSEGTIYCSFLAPTRGTGGLIYQVMFLSDGTVNEHIGLSRAFDPVQINANIVTGYSTQASFSIYPIPVGSQKVALTYKSNYSNLSAGGVLSSADATSLTVPNPTQLNIGQDSQYTQYGLNSTISRLTYYPQRLQNTTLQKLTR